MDIISSIGSEYSGCGDGSMMVYQLIFNFYTIALIIVTDK
jgi:hypothetical protein